MDEIHLGDAISLILANGGVMKARDEPGRYIHVPFTLDPVEFPRHAFERVKRITPVLHKLMDKVSRDTEFLREKLDHLRSIDEFMGKLLDVLDVVEREGEKQEMSLAILRSDYMLNNSSDQNNSILQIEVNTIASSFAFLSEAVTIAHRYRMQYLDRNVIIPENNPINIVRGIRCAHHHYVSSTAAPTRTSRAIRVLLVVQDDESNIMDQKLLEKRLFEIGGVRSVRKSLTELHEELSLDERHSLCLGNDCEISVVYFRAGYRPDDYPTSKEWDARLLIERSRAIKSPSIGYHLAGTKKIQQVLSLSSNLRRYLNEKEIREILPFFAKLYDLDRKDTDGNSAFNDAKSNSHNYVLKPQREGGGNNLFDKEIQEFLQEATPESLGAYILMERVRPPSHEALLVRNGAVAQEDCVSELGIYSVHLSDGKHALFNQNAGYLLRTKPITTNEGGVAAGFAMLSSIAFRKERIGFMKSRNVQLTLLVSTIGLLYAFIRALKRSQ